MVQCSRLHIEPPVINAKTVFPVGFLYHDDQRGKGGVITLCYNSRLYHLIYLAVQFFPHWSDKR